MVSVKLNNSNENPFYGLRNCLTLFQSVGDTISKDLLNKCWDEVKDNKIKRELFYSLLFSVGDITARQHNIFKGVKRDNGGNSNREGFKIILEWIWENQPKQFIKFLNEGLFNEYACFDALLRNRVQTKGTKVISVYSRLADEKYRKVLVEYLYKVVNGTNIFNKHLVAKFLSLPRLSKRSGHKKMLPQTKELMEHKVALLVELSKLMGWEYEVEGVYCNFKGYREWRKQYNTELESVLFSTGKINELDRESFIKWFDSLPANARYRVRNKILHSKVRPTNAPTEGGGTNREGVEVPKYPKLQEWYLEWEIYKESKQQEQRNLEEKIRQGQGSEEDLVKLEKVKKEAKVNVGATNFTEIYEQICTNNVDRLKIESFMNRVNLPYNSLVIIDDSGSMQGRPFNFATFIAAVCLVKNPDDDARNLLGFFNSNSHWYGFIDERSSRAANSIVRTVATKQRTEPFVDPKLSFVDNYNRIGSFCRAKFANGWSTNISAIPDGLKAQCDRNPELLDGLRSYPVWTIITDGCWNNLHSPEASMNDFMRKCENYFGFRPFVVAIDIASSSYGLGRTDANRFSGVDNMMYIPSNPAQIEMFLTNFKDMDVFDVFTPLQSIHRSNRYDLIRANTL